MNKPAFIAAALCCCASLATACAPAPQSAADSPAEPYFTECASGADSLIAAMSVRSRVAQLMWVTMPAYPSASDFEAVARCVASGAGGVLFMQSGPSCVRAMSDSLARLAALRPLFAIDGETGLSMRLTGTVPFPKMMTLGAVADKRLVEQMGREVAVHLKCCGIDVDFAPVADVNTNPDNPVIGQRSAGEDPQRVAATAVALMRGLQAGRVAAVAKHFPGHGNTSVDSHASLPVLGHSYHHLDSVDLMPFRALIDSGVVGVMSGHLAVPCLTGDRALPSSLSKRVLRDVLRDSLGFRGIVFSDAMNMQGVRKVSGRNASARAIVAGNDVAEFVVDFAAAVDTLTAWALADSALLADIDAKVRRVMALRSWCGAERVSVADVDSAVNNASAHRLCSRLFDASVTTLYGHRPDSVAAGALCHFAHPGISVRADSAQAALALVDLQSGRKPGPGTCILLTDNVSRARWQKATEGIDRSRIDVVYCGNPYRLKNYHRIASFRSLTVAYENCDRAVESLLRFVARRIEARGVMPVSVGPFAAGASAAPAVTPDAR